MGESWCVLMTSFLHHTPHSHNYCNRKTRDFGASIRSRAFASFPDLTSILNQTSLVDPRWRTRIPARLSTCSRMSSTLVPLSNTSGACLRSPSYLRLAVTLACSSRVQVAALATKQRHQASTKTLQAVASISSMICPVHHKRVRIVAQLRYRRWR
ncbi:hypothetical protein BKA70DRAFT_1336360 [Coprinopsis sp. MPI-PUGE-AT-0042]|nr:hypothetical protein BKA70DRAFT_1336360 [Coprinopsis sp. MPI-PUGE-AT-0042]